MRVTQRTMYTSMVGNMNSLLSDYMESNIQGSSMKKINRPSDDPAGSALVIMYRASLSHLAQDQTNSQTAKGWLKAADSTLGLVSDQIADIETLASQAAQETYNADQRKGIASQLRQILGTLINYSNAEFEGKHIFAGQQYTNSAYQEGLGVTIDDAKLSPKPTFQIEGGLPYSAVVRFPAVENRTPPYTGTIPPSHDPENPAADIVPTVYEYSMDGGKNWIRGEVKPGENSFTVGGAVVTVPQDPTFGPPPLNPNPNNVFQPNAYVEGTDVEAMIKGTKLTIRPTAIYQASDSNAKPQVLPYGNPSEPLPPDLTTNTEGKFSNDILVKFADAPHGIDLTKDGTTFSYSYSLDGGRTWVAGESEVTSMVTQEFVAAGSISDGTDGQPPRPAVDTPEQRLATARILVPGGYMDLQASYELDIIPGDLTQTPPVLSTSDPTTVTPATCVIPESTQFQIKPQRTDLGVEIYKGQYLSINNVGKDIFGGLYKAEYDSTLSVAFGEGDGRNLFETLGRLIGYCETNDTDGISQCIADTKLAHNVILTYDATIGGKENRVDNILSVIGSNRLDQETRKSEIEDVDLTQLMIKLTQQQMAYQTVLQSSSMIMQLNLTKYL